VWPWRLTVEVVAVTAIGAKGAVGSRTLDVGLGQEKARLVELPADTRAVVIERPVRVRVVLGRLRGDRRAEPRRRRPTWRDDSLLWLQWHTWRAERETARAYRRRHHR
jgi:hypothetical protein